MATQTIQRHCNTCQGPRPFDRPGTSHILHLLLTVFTAGLWLLVWVPLMMLGSGGSYRCRYCGGTATPFGLAWSTIGGLALFIFFGGMAAVAATQSVWIAFIPAGLAGLGLKLAFKPAKKTIQSR